MLNSNTRKKILSGWLKENHDTEFLSSLKLQKFLFFYETLSKIEEDSFDLRSLKGYVNGPVFSDVYGDYTYQKEEFSNESEILYKMNKKYINNDRAKFVGFLVKILNEKELSQLTHQFNIWSAKEREINSGTRNVDLKANDLNDSDEELLISLKEMYPTEFIDSVKVIQVAGKSFVMDENDFNKIITEDQQSVFITLAEEESLQNPVYISVDEDGVILVD